MLRDSGRLPAIQCLRKAARQPPESTWIIISSALDSARRTVSDPGADEPLLRQRTGRMSHTSNPILPTPALSAALRRSFAEDIQERLAALYQWVASQGGLAEQSPRRTQNTSFNPRPARLALIALKELHNTTEIEVAALFLSTIPPALPLAPPGLDAALELASQIQAYAPLHPLQPAAPLAACLALDTIRHLHLSETPHPSDLLAQASQLAHIISAEPRAVRLSEVLHHAITQQTLLLNVKSER